MRFLARAKRLHIIPTLVTQWRTKTRCSAALLFVRVLCGMVFWQHGLEKLFGFAGARPEPTLWAIRGVGGVMELIGGPLLALGFFTRPVAFLLSGEMAVAYFRAWAPRGLFPIANGGEEATLNAFLFLWLVFAGAGAWSVDAMLARWRRPSPGALRLTAWEPTPVRCCSGLSAF